MGEHNWSEVERLYADAARLERTGGAESERQAIYERLQARLRPIALSMARELVGDARRAEQIVETTLKYLPLLVARYAPTDATCAQWFGKTLIAFAYNAVLGKDAPLSRDPLSLLETRSLTEGEHQLIEWLLQTLTPDEFTVYYECVINGLSAAEVAAADGFEVSEVERLLLQAKQKVRDAFASEAGRRALTQALGMDLKWLGAPRPSDHSSAAYSVANNGAVAGVAFTEERRPREDGGEERVYRACAFRWQDGMLEELGALGEGGEPRCFITPEGDRIVAANNRVLLLWDRAHGVECSEVSGIVCGACARAETLVGQQDGRAVRWRNGVTEFLSSENPSAAHAVSADGALVVGHTHHKACLWDASGAPRPLGTLYGGCSEAWAVSADGQVVVGKSDDRAFRWTTRDGMVALRLHEDDFSHAYDVSADGACIVGKMLGERGMHAFLWTPNAGVEDLNELFAPWLSLHSMLECAYGVSPNGRYIVGEGYCAERERREAFLLDVGAPSHTN